jgi:hypothetical protein
MKANERNKKGGREEERENEKKRSAKKETEGNVKREFEK